MIAMYTIVVVVIIVVVVVVAVLPIMSFSTAKCRGVHCKRWDRAFVSHPRLHSFVMSTVAIWVLQDAW